MKKLTKYILLVFLFLNAAVFSFAGSFDYQAFILNFDTDFNKIRIKRNSTIIKPEVNRGIRNNTIITLKKDGILHLFFPAKVLDIIFTGSLKFKIKDDNYFVLKKGKGAKIIKGKLSGNLNRKNIAGSRGLKSDISCDTYIPPLIEEEAYNYIVESIENKKIKEILNKSYKKSREGNFYFLISKLASSKKKLIQNILAYNNYHKYEIMKIENQNLSSSCKKLLKAICYLRYGYYNKARRYLNK
ncbi:MAG TPA: hypothetical protein VKN74_03005 [Candidatus Mcinerneyibacterium sp.]|nr:hypothetical protein [Candidatus Mcinerneyibacterium sp.]